MNYKDYNDYELLYLIEEEDEDASALLEKKYMPYIYKEAQTYYKLLNSYDLQALSFEELISIGKTTLHRTSKCFDEKKNILFYTYFTSCLRNSFSIYRRSLFNKKNYMFSAKLKEYDIEDVLPLKELEKSKNPLFLCEKREEEDVLYQFMIDLEGVDRYIFELYYNGFRNREIAVLLDVTVTLVNRVVYKVKQKLKKRLENYSKVG